MRRWDFKDCEKKGREEREPEEWNSMRSNDMRKQKQQSGDDYKSCNCPGYELLEVPIHGALPMLIQYSRER